MIHNGKMSRVVVLRKLFRNVCILYAYYWRLYFSGMYCGEFIWILLSFHGNAVSDTLTFISTSVGFHENVGTISISTQTDSKKNTWATQEFLHWYSAIVFLESSNDFVSWDSMQIPKLETRVGNMCLLNSSVKLYLIFHS